MMKHRSIGLVAPLLALLLAIIGILFALHDASQSSKEELTGDYHPWDIWPVIVVDNQYYKWTKMVDATWAVLPPEHLVYVADIQHVQAQAPTENYQLMTDISISGEIYIDLDEEADCLYLLVTTDWLEDAYVVFTATSDGYVLD